MQQCGGMETASVTPNRNPQVEERRNIDHCESSTSNEEAGQRPQSTKPLSSKINDYWVWEIVSCSISLIALAAIIAVLLEYDGKSIPDWPYGITINSVLSWITQILTASMAAVVASCLSQSKWIYFSMGDRPLADMNSYDWASRGPLGCTAFLWNSRMKCVSSSRIQNVI